MNIFVTSYNPEQCAQEHCIVHANKMLVEYAQIMSTCHHIWSTRQSNMYQPTHEKHPSTVWACASKDNYQWLYVLWCSLGKLYIERNGVMHKSYEQLSNALMLPEKQGIIIAPRFTKKMMAMPSKFKGDDVAESYQQYLNSKFKEWTEREKKVKVSFFNSVPAWFNLGE